MNKNTSARIVALLLAVLMVCPLFSVEMFAAETTATATDGSDTNNGYKTSIDDVKALLATMKYSEYSELHKDKSPSGAEFVIDCTDYIADTSTGVIEVLNGSELDGMDGKVLSTSESGKVEWKVNVPATGMYYMEVTYYPIESKATNIERTFSIDGDVPYSEARYLTFTKVWKEQYEVNESGEIYFESDFDGNDIRPDKIEAPDWRTVTVYDTDGTYTDPLSFYLEKGEHTFAFDALREPIVLKSIRFYSAEKNRTYADVLAEYEAKGYKEVSADATLKIQAEMPSATSDQTLYPLSDRTSAITEPQHSAHLLLNSIGSDKWSSPGQWIRYTVTPTETGLYTIVIRYKQELLQGMFASRRLYINDEIPFDEAGRIRFNFSEDWQVAALGDGEGTDYQFYFEAGKTYDIALEVCMGDLGDMVNRVATIAKALNDDYLMILQLTGAVPDEYRDYGFGRVIPGTIRDLAAQKVKLQEVLEYINTTNGMKGSQVSTIEDLIRILTKMTSSEDEVAKNMSDLKTYVGNLSTWVNDARTQPLEVDYYILQGASQKKPTAEAGFWQALSHEVGAFIASFFYDYNNIASGELGEEAIVIWVTGDRDSTKIKRNLIDNDFTPSTGYDVDLKLVDGGALLPSILAGCGPDLNAMGSADVINYAIRGAVLPIYTNDPESPCYNVIDSDEIDEIMKRFPESARNEISFKGYRLDGFYLDELYGLPDTMSFDMLYYRKDIFAQLDLEVPATWDDMLALVPVLQFNNMVVGMSANYINFLYQSGGEQWADDGMRINLDSNVALEAFEKMVNMYTQYSLPYAYSFGNRFRTGEMPVGVGDYVSIYNQLVVFASELRGLWGMAPLPGTVRADGTIDHTDVTSCSAVVFLKGIKHIEGSWEYMKWYTDVYYQSQFTQELTALVGPAAKRASANREAIMQMNWTVEELEAILEQFDHLATIMNYPGGYILGRYTDFAFNAAYNDGKDPVESLLQYIPLINKEISRKREEFGLETLEPGQTLAEKRAEEAAKNAE